MIQENKRVLEPTSREYFDIKLYSIMAHAAIAADDDNLGKIFYYLMNTQGSEYSCKGQEAISEGKKHVEELIHACKIQNLLIERKHVQQYAMWILAEFVQNGDFSNIIELQKKALDEGIEGVTQEGIDKANALIFELMEKYKNMPSIGKALKG